MCAGGVPEDAEGRAKGVMKESKKNRSLFRKSVNRKKLQGE